MRESWTTLLEPLSDLEVSPDLRAQVEARRRHEVVTGEDTSRRRVRRLALGCAAGLAVVLFVVVMVIAAHSRHDRPAPAHHAPPDRTKSSSGTRRFGEPIELDGMTFVVKDLVMVPSVPIPNGEPLKPPHGSSLWVLTVSVRNDGETLAHEPFCHQRRPQVGTLGVELISGVSDGGGVWYHGWSRDSLLIDPNHQFCNYIAPGSTETFQLLFYAFRSQGKMEEVLLSHRSSSEKDFSYARVARCSWQQGTRCLP
jgi:hypothetical protein